MENTLLTPVQEQALTRIWRNTVGVELNTSETSDRDLKHAYDLGFGTQELLQFLYGQRPDLPRFLQWATDNNSALTSHTLITEDVLSTADLEHWNEQGYIVIRQAVTEEEYTAANKAIWDFLEADPADTASWYRDHPAKNGLMVVFTQHPALQAIRHSPRIRKAYEQLYGTTAIYKVIDKVSFNPPQNDQNPFMGTPLHWDTSLELPIPDRFQGLLYLSDVTAAGGAFQCVPGFHQRIGEWINEQPAGTDLRKLALDTLQPTPITGNAGDFIIWHQALPHCASPNLGQQPRLVQYLTYLPDNFSDNRAWK